MLEITSKEVLAHLQEMGVTARTAQSSISRTDAEALEARIGGAHAAEGQTAEGPADQIQADGAPEKQAPETQAPGKQAEVRSESSLFSAVEAAQPVAESAGDTTAPLFLPPSPATDDRAEKSGSKPAQQPAADETAPEESAPQKSATQKSATQKSATEQSAPEQPATGRPADEESSSDGEQDSRDKASDDSGDDDSGDGRSRRRRRGRRGRGRGRGDQNQDADHESTQTADSSEDGDATRNGDKQGGNNQGGNNQGGDKQPGRNRSGGDAGKDTKGRNQNTDDGGTDDTNASKDTNGAKDADNGGNGNGGNGNGGNGNGDDAENGDESRVPASKRRRRRRRRRGGADADDASSSDDPPNTVVHEREPRAKRARDEVQGISGSTRLEAKRQRRRDGRDAGRRRPPILTESEFLARRESVERVMVVRERAANTAITENEPHAAPTEDYTQIAVLEDGVLVEHFVTTETSQSMVGNIYLGRVQNVLPGMEAAFVDIGRGRNGVLYAGEVNWEAAGLGGGSRKIEQALKPGDHVMVQVSKDPVGHKGARLTTQISLAGRYLVYVPGGTSTGISRKLPDTERRRLKQILAKLVPDEAGVIIRTASEGVSAEELGADIERLEAQWKSIEAASQEHTSKGSGTTKALYEEPELLVRVVRDLFNEDFRKLVIEGDRAWKQVSGYVADVAPDLTERLEQFSKEHADSPDSFTVHRIDEQLAKALDRKVWLPSGGTLIIERTEAMTVVDVNTGKFTGSGGNLEETVTRNNLEAAEEIVRQMRLRDIGGMIVVDFIDMVLESNRDLVLRRLTEALSRDRTRHQVSEVTSLGLVQMTRKRLGTGLLEAFSTTCTACSGRGVIVHADPVEVRSSDDSNRSDSGSRRSRRSRKRGSGGDNGGGSSDQQGTKPAHKPAAEHPLFRAMAHHEGDSTDEGPSADETRSAAEEHSADEGGKTPGKRSGDTGKRSGDTGKRSGDTDSPNGEGGTGSGRRRDKASRDTSGGHKNSGDKNSGGRAAVEQQPDADTASAPRTAATPEGRTPEDRTPEDRTPEAEAPAAESGVVVRRRRRAVRRAASPTGAGAPAPEPTTVTSEPVTTVAQQTAQPVVEVTRTPRRRSGRRAAGPPPQE
ncbi:Rne/Rng family ribonuclease [Gordonia shandongensis]|uniref:Rne/Rng family ribonuclease n=1 Tax=Gordonia shandongensis TaxID=376351 RepID=UPI000428530D